MFAATKADLEPLHRPGHGPDPTMYIEPLESEAGGSVGAAATAASRAQ